MRMEDILLYLNSSRKDDTLDPLHNWIATYNLRRIVLGRFFKWLYYPNDDPKKRKVPAVIENIPLLKRREQSIYKPTDLWTVADDYYFPCRKKMCRLEHVMRWMNLFIDMHNG